MSWLHPDQPDDSVPEVELDKDGQTISLYCMDTEGRTIRIPLTFHQAEIIATQLFVFTRKAKTIHAGFCPNCGGPLVEAFKLVGQGDKMKALMCARCAVFVSETP